MDQRVFPDIHKYTKKIEIQTDSTFAINLQVAEQMTA